MVLKIPQKFQENTCIGVSSSKGFIPMTCNFIKAEPQKKCLLANFTNFLMTAFLQNTSGRLLPSQGKLGFIESTDHRPTDQPIIDHLPTDRPAH